MERIRFVTDSAADIPRQWQEQLHIEVLPFTIAMENTEYQDGVDFGAQEFYETLQSLPYIPTHSQLNPMAFTQCYERAYQEGYGSLIYTAINAKGSSTYQNAVLARSQFYQEHPVAEKQFAIFVLDSGTYTMAYGYGVVLGARLAQEGKAAEERVQAIQNWIAHARILFTPMNLKFAKKSGRISAAAAFLGDALGLHPIMTFENGESKILAKVRGDKNVIPAMLERAKQSRVPDTPYFCIFGSEENLNEEITAASVRVLQAEAAGCYYIGGVIAINAGPNVIGILYQEKDAL